MYCLSFIVYEPICRYWNAGLKIMTKIQDAKYEHGQKEIDKEFLWSKHNKVRRSSQQTHDLAGRKELRITR